MTMESFTHAFCESCESIQPVTMDPLTMNHEGGKFLGGDISCGKCNSTIATVFKKTGDTRTRTEPRSGRRRGSRHSVGRSRWS